MTRLKYYFLLSVFAVIAVNADKPNILFIFSDDQSYETIRAAGQLDIDTPNLDRLADQGTYFTHAYNMGSYSPAVCVASRTMLVTGRSLWKAKRVTNDLTESLESGRLWPQRMAAAGYETYFTGKWHIRTDAKLAFDHSTHIRPGMPRQTSEGYNRPIAGEPDPWSPSDPQFGGFWAGGRHWSEVLGDDATRFLEQASTSEKPFFMYLAFNAPHDPRQSPQEYVDRYPLDRISMPETFLPEYPYNEAMASGRKLRDERLAPFPRDEYAVKVNRQEYFAIVTHMDTQVGRILDALEATGQADTTWIFFTSDHGLAVGHHGLMGKQNMYDHSIRVPFIVKGPGVPAGRQIDSPIYLQDAMATALDLADADSSEIEFQSLLPLLAGSPSVLDGVYGAYLDAQRAVIDDGWKLILYPAAKTARLYHLDEDPMELNDLAADPAMAERKKALFAKLLELQKTIEDPLSVAEIYPDLTQ